MPRVYLNLQLRQIGLCGKLCEVAVLLHLEQFELGRSRLRRVWKQAIDYAFADFKDWAD